jgi:two-component system nitrogen regulation response regulator GlnG
MPVLLVVDDEPAILHAFRRVFREPEIQLLTAERGAEGIAIVREQNPDVVILDIKLPDMSGLDAYRDIRAMKPKLPVIFITGHGTTETAIEATKRGAYDYLFKPLELSELRRIVDSAFSIAKVQKVAPRIETDKPLEEQDGDILVGRSPAMNDVYKAIGRVASQDVNVLITGESGTGKELVARAIYHHSKRENEPFLAINCAAIPDAILESELFGHERGAFTGADKLRIGKFEQCTGGTMFLDEVGDMSPTTQAKILRLLEEQRFERVGGNETVQTDVRLIAATNRNLEQMVADGDFREDLYFRLSVFAIPLPPLRERGGDLPRLVEHFVTRFARELGKDVHTVHADTLELLTAYSWPGNVRELQSVLKQSLLHAAGSVLIPEFLPSYIRTSPGSSVERTDGSFNLAKWDEFITSRIQEDSGNLYEEATLMTDHHLLMLVLRHTQGNQLQAAKTLGISRATLRNKLRVLKISLDDMKW